MSGTTRDDEVVVSPALLRDRPLPTTGASTDKGSRGQVLIVGGSDETPGAVLLAGVAALRAGAGKLQIATAASVATAVGVAVPEARVVALPTHASGALAGAAGEEAAHLAARADAVLVGTGGLDTGASGALLAALVPALGPETALVVDACALPVLAEQPELIAPVRSRTVLVPNLTEAALLLPGGAEALDDGVAPDPRDLLDRAVGRLGCVVAVRSPDTLLGAPGAGVHVDRSGHPALGTSGSGDVLAGIVTGLLARGTEPLDAALWAVHVHGRAGEQVASSVGGLGVLARELLDEIPRVIAALAGSGA